MIVRVMTENQYRLSDDEAADLDRLDDPLYEAIQSGDDLAFALALEKVIAFVRNNGEVVPIDEVVPSDVIIPAPDMTVTEARQYLQQADVLAAKASPAEPAASSGE